MIRSRWTSKSSNVSMIGTAPRALTMALSSVGYIGEVGATFATDPRDYVFGIIDVANVIGRQARS